MDWFTVGADSSSRRVVAVSEERTSDGMETIYTVEHRAHCRFSLRTLPTSCRMRDSIASMGDAACS
jgi:hypothetical protein